MTNLVVRAIACSLLFLVAMKATQYAAKNYFRLSVSNPLLLWVWFVISALAVYTKVVLNSKMAALTFTLALIAFWLAALIDAVKKPGS